MRPGRPGNMMKNSQDSQVTIGHTTPTVDRNIPNFTILVCAFVSILVLISTFIIQNKLIMNSDLGWLFTVDEYILSGKKLDVDIFELNPPLSPYMYMPAVMIGKAINTSPEITVTILILIGILTATFLFWKISVAFYKSRSERAISALLLLSILCLLPDVVFGQREHIAVIALTPFIALAAARNSGYRPSALLSLAAGLGAGFAMSIKPHFAIVAGLPLLLRCLQSRSFRPLHSIESIRPALSS